MSTCTSTTTPTATRPSTHSGGRNGETRRDAASPGAALAAGAAPLRFPIRRPRLDRTMENPRIDALRKMLELSPNDPRLRFGLAAEYERLGRWELVVDELREYL